MGRRLKGAEKRGLAIVTKVTAAEHDSVEKWAKHVGLTTSEFVRKCVSEKILELAGKVAPSVVTVVASK